MGRNRRTSPGRQGSLRRLARTTLRAGNDAGFPLPGRPASAGLRAGDGVAGYHPGMGVGALRETLVPWCCSKSYLHLPAAEEAQWLLLTFRNIAVSLGGCIAGAKGLCSLAIVARGGRRCVSSEYLDPVWRECGGAFRFPRTRAGYAPGGSGVTAVVAAMLAAVDLHRGA